MFKFNTVPTTPLPRWLEAQARVAAQPTDAEKARLLGEQKEEKLVCHSRVRTAAILATLVMTMLFLAALIYLVYQGTRTLSSARDTVGTRVTNLMNLTEQMAVDTKSGINALRGASQNAELFTSVSFAHLANASAKMASMTEFMDRSIHQPLTLRMRP